MNTTLLLDKFSRGMVWNGLFYTVYKVLFVSLSFTLYHNLSTTHFSMWAMANSFIFILLLWLDCGLRKSIPRYCPAFAKDKKVHRKFVAGLIIFQALLLTFLGIPLLWFCLSRFEHLILLTWYAFGVFITEGMVALLRLVYHAHFWQKQFNLLHTLCVLIEMVVNFCFIASAVWGVALVKTIFMAKMVSGIAVTLISIWMLPQLYKDKAYPGNETVNVKKTIKDFVIHSAVMWASTITKSLSERNVLFPYLTFLIGPASANLFKIAHDGALFFQRMALKTIGVTDTSLLSHLEEDHKSKKLFQKAFTQLVKKVTLLCLPLFTIGIICMRYPTLTSQNSESISIFIFAVSGYILEIMLSPYERVLETKRDYKWLWFAYTPYLTTMLLCFAFVAAERFSLANFIVIIHIARLSGSILMTLITRKKYGLQLPIKFIGTIALGCSVPLLLLGIFY